jgi:exosome complex component RRP40
LDDDSVILTLLGKIIPFEIAVGMNGRVWIKAENSKMTVILVNAILSSEHLTSFQMQSLVEKLKPQLLTTES